MLFWDVKESDENLTWFVLYPFLSQRRVRRRVLSGSENWAILRDKMRTRLLSRLNLFLNPQQRVKNALGSSRSLSSMQERACEDDIDVTFASIVKNGRRFASGIFSILVFTFVGTLTSALSIWICEERDGVMFLSQEPYVECSLNVPEYKQLFFVAIFGLIMYGLVLPVSIFMLLRSKWSQQMRMYDLNGFDTVFGFLVSRYSAKYFMWEVLIFFQKAASVLIPTYNDSAVQQSIWMLFVSMLYLFLMLKYSPFANKMMNFIETLCSINLFLMYMGALLFIAEVDGQHIIQGRVKETLGICLCTICIFSVVSTVACSW